MSKYLITGITGFVGPHLAELLLNIGGNEVYGLVRGSNGNETDILDVLKPNLFREIKFLYGDLCYKGSLDSIFSNYTFDGVFHLAAQSHPPTSFEYPFHTFEVNSIGTINLVESLLKNQPKCKLLNCSTSEVYGVVPEGKVTEQQPLNPINPYGVSKACADMYVSERAKTTGACFFNTRAFSHTGPRRGYKFSISSDAFQIAKILSGKQEKRIRVGTLSSRRVVIDVRDCVKAYYLLMQMAVPGESYNVGGEIIYSMADLLGNMLSIYNLNDIEFVVDTNLVRPIDIPIQICDCSKLKQLTKWNPSIPIETTLYDLVNYWVEKVKGYGK